MESVSTWVGSQEELVRETVLCAALVGDEDGSMWGASRVSSQSDGAAVWTAC